MTVFSYRGCLAIARISSIVVVRIHCHLALSFITIAKIDGRDGSCIAYVKEEDEYGE